ncbi:GNAT family N-acetyltransferase (plasmid) [Embleya sp. NBC_00888]|uniref:GNAT family N-acetyltransferase n=1 Tax=Embleya sp. NBC_00888 TaxID=2975960 RepID=UPI002F9170A5|nr:GNAT family N-acetyltransferase [Embleya sp. NBC_00888]
MADHPAATHTLRPAAADDLPAMADVFIQAWRSGYRGVVPDEVIDSLRPAQVALELAGGLDDARLTTVLATDTDGRPVGFARYGDSAEHPGDGCLAALYVHPLAAGAGLGRRLLRHALDAMAERDVWLYVFEANTRARGVYDRAGFRPAGPRRTDPRRRTPEVLMLRRARNRPRPLAPLPDVELPRIRSVTTTVLRRPLRRPFRTALRTVRELSAVEVVLRTGDGDTVSGTTVATPAITGDTEEAILAAVHGPIANALCRGPRPFGEGLAAVAAALRGVPSARAAADIALHNLAARRIDPDPGGLEGLAALFGNRPAPVRTDLTISLDDPPTMAAAAREAVAEGFDTLKLKLADPEHDVERVAAVHAGLGGASRTAVLRLDANQAWTRDEAVRTLDRIAALDIDIELVEQPVAAGDIDGLAYLRARSPWPVLADESVFTADDVRRVADASAADLVNLKLLKCGGLGPARDVIAACAEAGLGLVVGCMLEPEEGVAAAHALAAAASTGPHAHDLDAGWWTAT